MDSDSNFDDSDESCASDGDTELLESVELHNRLGAH
jgi:hypothetical protein